MSAKFKAGDSVVVVKELSTAFTEYPYKLGHVFTIVKIYHPHDKYGGSYGSNSDGNYCTYDEFLDFSHIHKSPLWQELK